MAGTERGAELVPDRVGRESARREPERPCRVYIHNDAVTPMDFVVHVLVTVFLLPTINAEQIMYAAHLNGRAYVQTLPATEARRRIARARFAASLRTFPLEFSMEAE